MKQWLELNLMPGQLNGATSRELFRNAVEQKLIPDSSSWVRYHELRNSTSHAYNMEVAEEIYLASKSFLEDAVYLLGALEDYNE
ncbi:nucleotidyltransferase substrate binding protein (TIGR01987 family) [Desulfitispora alkaliphila]